MKIARIQTEPTEATNNEQSFKAIKLRGTTIRKAERTLKRDTFELRKNLPDNKDTVVNKYFGQPANNDGHYEATTADVVVGLGAMAIGLGLALL